MSLERLRSLPAELVRRTQDGPADKFGSNAWQDADPVDILIHLEPLSSDEARETPAGIIRFRAYLAGDVGIGLHDRITTAYGWEGEVAGPPLVYWHPRRKAISHIVVELTDVTGGA